MILIESDSTFQSFDIHTSIPSIRKSFIESYSFCPYQFYLQYIEQRRQRMTYALISGTRFHQIAERFFDYASHYPIDHWPDFIPHTFGSYERSMVEFFIDTEIQRFIDNPDLFQPYALELSINSLSEHAAGTIDRVDWISRNDKTVRVVEYKTSSKVDDASLLRQFNHYKLLIESTTDLTVTQGYLINPRLRVCKTYDNLSIEKARILIEQTTKLFINRPAFKKSCSEVKFMVCMACKNPDEANLYQGLEYETWKRE